MSQVDLFSFQTFTFYFHDLRHFHGRGSTTWIPPYCLLTYLREHSSTLLVSYRQYTMPYTPTSLDRQYDHFPQENPESHSSSKRRKTAPTATEISRCRKIISQNFQDCREAYSAVAPFYPEGSAALKPVSQPFPGRWPAKRMISMGFRQSTVYPKPTIINSITTHQKCSTTEDVVKSQQLSQTTFEKLRYALPSIRTSRNGVVSIDGVPRKDIPPSTFRNETLAHESANAIRFSISLSDGMLDE